MATTINRIQSGLAGQTSLLPPSGIQSQSTAPIPSRTGESAGDIFTRGQWWRNRATSVDTEGKILYGAAAYKAQEKAGQKTETEPRSPATETEGHQSPERAPESRVKNSGQETDNPENGEKAKVAVSPSERKASGVPLTETEKQQIIELAAADTEVRSHEMAHLSAAGPYALSGANYQFQQGPNGKQYAVAGEVNIDTSEETSPQTTINKMQTVRAAALAPANPSGQDRRVAASAAVKTGVARQELNTEQIQKLEFQHSEAANPRGATTPAGTTAPAFAPSGQVKPNDSKGEEAYRGKTLPSFSPPPRIRAYSVGSSPIPSLQLDFFL